MAKSSNALTPLYAALADELSGLISEGALQAGDRLPSVRHLSGQRRISMATALAALRALELRGLVEARPKSGYFVRVKTPTAAEPHMTRPPVSAKSVGVSALISRVIAATTDPGVISFGAAVPDASWYPTDMLQRLLGRVARKQGGLLGQWSDVAGLESLRHQIQRRYAALGCALELDELLITNGCMEALNLAVRAVAAPGDTIAVESPTYHGFLQIIESMGMKVMEIATHPRDGFSVESLAEALSGPAGRSIKACLVSSSFSNPMGGSLSEQGKQALLALCRKHQVALIEDDIVGDLHFSSQRPRPIKTFDRDGDVILCSSFSKTLAPGARIGWIAAGAWTEQVRLKKFTASLATSVMPQHMLAQALQTTSYDRHLLKLRQTCARQVDRFSEAVTAYFPAGTRISRPGGGFVLWVELAAGSDSLELYERARQAGIDFAPGPLFSASGRYRNFLRLNCGRMLTPPVERALAKLGQLAGEIPG